MAEHIPQELPWHAWSQRERVDVPASTIRQCTSRKQPRALIGNFRNSPLTGEEQSSLCPSALVDA